MTLATDLRSLRTRSSSRAWGRSHLYCWRGAVRHAGGHGGSGGTRVLTVSETVRLCESPEWQSETGTDVRDYRSQGPPP